MCQGEISRFRPCASDRLGIDWRRALKFPQRNQLDYLFLLSSPLEKEREKRKHLTLLSSLVLPLSVRSQSFL